MKSNPYKPFLSYYPTKIRYEIKKSGTDIGVKSVYGPNREMVQNVGTKSVFTSLFSTALSLIGDLFVLSHIYMLIWLINKLG